MKNKLFWIKWYLATWRIPGTLRQAKHPRAAMLRPRVIPAAWIGRHDPRDGGIILHQQTLIISSISLVTVPILRFRDLGAHCRPAMRACFDWMGKDGSL